MPHRDLSTSNKIQCNTNKSDRAIEHQNLVGNHKLGLVREACEFFYSLCPYPTPKEYEIMARTLCDKYPELKNKIPVNGSYWVRFIFNNIYLLY